MSLNRTLLAISGLRGGGDGIAFKVSVKFNFSRALVDCVELTIIRDSPHLDTPMAHARDPVMVAIILEVFNCALMGGG